MLQTCARAQQWPTRLLAAVVAGAVAGDEVLGRLAGRRCDRVGGVQVLDLVRQAALRLLVARILRGTEGSSAPCMRHHSGRAEGIARSSSPRAEAQC